MSYGTIKVDTITFTDGGVDKSVSVSGLTQNPTITGNLTVTGTISGDLIQGQTVSGTTITGGDGQFTTITGTTVNTETVNAVSGVFSTSVSGATVQGTAGDFATITGGVTTITSGVFALGTNALPSISFSSDPDTGIYSPGADQVAISTNGTGRLFIDASGNVGVGSSPSAWSAFTALQIQKGSIASTGDDLNLMANAYYDGSDYRRIGTQGVARQYFNTDGSFIWSRAGTGTANSTVAFSEVMRIDSSGRLGLGTSTFVNNVLLSLKSDTGTRTCGILFEDTGTSGRKYGIYSGGGTFSFRDFTAGENRLNIDSSGRLGIGTGSPGTLLELSASNNAGSSNNTLRFTDTDGSSGTDQQTGKIEFYTSDVSQVGVQAYILGAAENASGAGGLRFGTGVAGSALERLRITNTGNVGIGTTTPLDNLQVGSDSSAHIAIANTGTTDITSGINWRFGSAGVVYSKILSAASGASSTYLSFHTSNSEKARIDSSGRLLVGTSSTSAANTVLLQSSSAGSTTQAILTLARGQAAPADSALLGSLRYADSGHVSAAEINVRRDAGTWTSGVSQPTRLEFSTTADAASSPTARMTIKADGKVGIGTTTPGRALEVRSGTDDVVINAVSSDSGAFISFEDDGTTSDTHVRVGCVGNDLRFDAGNSEKARIDSSGRLLVGTTSSSEPCSAVLQGNSTASTGNSRLILARGTTSIAADGTLGLLSFSDSGHVNAASLTAQRDGGTWTSGSSQPTRLVFSTTADSASSPTERMRISSNGDVNVLGTFYAKYNAVYTWNTTAGIKAVGDGSANTGGVGIETTTTTTNTRYHVSFSNGNGVVGSISTNGSATAYNTSSDYRLKENVVPLTGAADRVNQLQVHRFNFIADPDTVVDGFIAHEVQAVVPECVTGTKDEVDAEGNPAYQGIDQSKLVPLLTAALQEALQKIETQAGVITALDARLKVLEGN